MSEPNNGGASRRPHPISQQLAPAEEVMSVNGTMDTTHADHTYRFDQIVLVRRNLWVMPY
jgi:hypothetical protein